MLSLSKDDVRMQATAGNKDEALAVLCDILVEDGLVDAAYLQGLKDRETQSSTYLGQGIAIPHGMPSSRDSIKQTGVRLVHFADGVVWNDAGDKVHLAVVIAAKSDEHLQILQNLTKVLSDDVSDAIANARQADNVIDALNAKKQFIQQARLICLDVPAVDEDELYLQALQQLKAQNLISSIFLPKHEPSKLSHALSCVVLENHPALKGSALAIAANQTQALAVVSATASIDKDALEQAYDVLMSDEFAQAITQGDKAAVLTLLGIDHQDGWVSASVVLPIAHGLHARPATALSELAKQADGDVKVCVDDGDYVSAKSLTRLLSLGAGMGQTLTFIAKPQTDAAALLPKLVEAVQAGLGDEVVPITKTASKTTPAQDLADLAALSDTKVDHLPILDGEKIPAIAAAAGLAVGKAYVIKPLQFDYPMTADVPADELARLNAAIDAVKNELAALIADAKKAQIAQIFSAHLALLDDEEITTGAYADIQAGKSAPAAWHGFIEKLANAQAALGNHLLAERAQDLRDIGQKVLLKLLNQQIATAPDSPYVLIKEDLLPSDVANLDPACVAGIITAVGGASSHSAIIARALGIPALVGAGGGVLTIENETTVLLDGSQGWFVVRPDEQMVSDCQQAQIRYREQKRLAGEQAHLPAITLDNHRIEVAANLGNVADTADAVTNGAEGVGLLRTELVFMSHTQIPDIDTQIADYEQVFDALDGKPLVVRVLDIGGDKALPYLPMAAEENPFLGLRGIRLLLAHPQMLRSQLTALILASKGRDLRIMFPMIGRIEEWRAARAILDEVLAEYPHDNLQVGIMLEVPSAAVLASHFAKEVDFFSIGTNDLTQYVLAIDRGHPQLSKDADGLHPSILTLIHQVVQAAHAHGKWVGVCGELACDAKAVPILLGLGVDELSMSSGAIALVKAQIRTLSFANAKTLAKQALQCQTASQVRQLTEGAL
ncbi:phosphoenolpyruvate--protein phosphotransferase [Moraxella sp. ZJ142]|uniref:phosphoenolpyruvate--protein phosphotransferase n=1 Tax=Moraxella marmotae TaxID=3344520 RepID=UPI0035D3E5D8